MQRGTPPPLLSPELLGVITSRVSALKLGDPGPSGDDVAVILDAAASAPDHGRLAPWRFVVIEGAARERLGALLATSAEARHAQITAAQLEAERLKAFRAPMVMIAAAHLTPSAKVPGVEQILAVGAAVENMFLAAHALGYGAMWRTGPAAYDRAVKQGLGLEPDDHVVAFLYLGTVLASGTPRARGKLEDVVRHLHPG